MHRALIQGVSPLSRFARACGLVTIGLTLLSSCSKEEEKGNAPSASASAPAAVATTPAPAASPASTPSPAGGAPAAASVASNGPPPPKCPAGLTGNPFPAYCIKLPPSYGVKQAKTIPTRGSIEYETGTTTDNLMISFNDSPLAQVAKDVESEMKFGGDKLEKKGDLPGGNKWFQGVHADYSRIVTLFKGQGGLTLKCSFAYVSKKAPPKDAIDACRSIVVP
jgi:hypothetical protein